MKLALFLTLINEIFVTLGQAQSSDLDDNSPPPKDKIDDEVQPVPPDNKGVEWSLGSLAGLAVLSVVVLGGLAVAGYYCYKNKRTHQRGIRDDEDVI